ncbi:hypothetical protein BIW11_13694 [Tropilaelaps mercedesae]|uniref:PWWP domain-containing protein n=1 Tax=Tropilaelaps mercedesae TaxID=418985 RepID=A0A1V9X0Z4_9ACAR|nr:hypothetical protein BIW11_13694 [Tropilaelaps mercedesae]
MSSTVKRTLSPGALVFAKVKGYPHWPARVEEVRPGDKYRVLFFGTYEVGIIDIKCLFDYEENKARFARPNKKRFFMEALEEIEKRPNMKPPMTHIMGRVGGEKKSKEAPSPTQPPASGGKTAKDHATAGTTARDARSAQTPAKETKVVHGSTKEAKATPTITKEAKSKDARTAAAASTTPGTPTGPTSTKDTTKRGGGAEKKRTTNESLERRKSEHPSGAVSVEKKSDKAKKVSPTRPPAHEASSQVTPKRKRPEESADKSDAPVTSSPEEKPLQHSRAGRAIKPKRLDGEVVEIETRSPRKSLTPSPDAKKEKRQGHALSGATARQTDSEKGPLFAATDQQEKAAPKGRRKTTPSTDAERADSPTTKRARSTNIGGADERKCGSPMQSPKAVATGSGGKKALGNAKPANREAKTAAAAAAATEASTADDDDGEVCSECHRRSPRKHDHHSQDEDEGGLGSPVAPAEAPLNSPANSKAATGSPGNQAKSAKQEARSKGPTVESPETARALREEARSKGAPSADELQRQVAFLELTDKKIRANMGGERMDPDSALDAIVVLEGSFITATALMNCPKILNTLRHVRRYPTNERLARKADFMYNKIKNYMMTVFISEDEKERPGPWGRHACRAPTNSLRSYLKQAPQVRPGRLNGATVKNERMSEVLSKQNANVPCVQRLNKYIETRCAQRSRPLYVLGSEQEYVGESWRGGVLARRGPGLQ